MPNSTMPQSSVPRSTRTQLVVTAVLLCASLGTAANRAQADPPFRYDAEFNGPVDASQLAVRKRLPNLLAFPMQVAPRCDILSNYGDYRSGGRRHQGIDMLATLGQEVYAVGDGVITDKVIDDTNGSTLSGNLLDVTTTTARYAYAHLSGFAPGIEIGTEVEFGQLIGYVGDTGNPGPGNYHLHFEIHPGGGNAVNPLNLLTIPQGCKVF
jgi:murein DD-endopeptidase MepM/ murein hydrolase activator NlpD